MITEAIHTYYKSNNTKVYEVEIEGPSYDLHAHRLPDVREHVALTFSLKFSSLLGHFNIPPFSTISVTKVEIKNQSSGLILSQISAPSGSSKGGEKAGAGEGRWTLQGPRYTRVLGRWWLRSFHTPTQVSALLAWLLFDH